LIVEVETNAVAGLIAKAIDILKHVKPYIPRAKYLEYIDRINTGISKSECEHGAIIQLKEPVPYGVDVPYAALLSNVKCRKCKTITTFSGNVFADVFAPARCPKCRNRDMYQTPYINQDTKPQKSMCIVA